jgi:hypothetical protein
MIPWRRARTATKARKRMATEDGKKNNLRMALVLASIALAFFIGFMIKMYLLSKA